MFGLALFFQGQDVFLDGRHGQGASGLDDAARVDEDVLDGGAHLIGVDRDEVVDQVLCDAKSLLAHQFDGGAVGEKTHIAQRPTLTRVQGLDHRVGVVHLHTDHFDLRSHGLDVVGHPGDQAPAPDGHEDRVKLAGDLSQHLHGHGALTRDHIGVVKGVHKGEALLFLQRQSVLVRIAVALAVEHHVSAQGFHRIDLDAGRGHGHHDGGF